MESDVPFHTYTGSRISLKPPGLFGKLLPLGAVSPAWDSFLGASYFIADRPRDLCDFLRGSSMTLCDCVGFRGTASPLPRWSV